MVRIERALFLVSEPRSKLQPAPRRAERAPAKRERLRSRIARARRRCCVRAASARGNRWRRGKWTERRWERSDMYRSSVERGSIERRGHLREPGRGPAAVLLKLNEPSLLLLPTPCRRWPGSRPRSQNLQALLARWWQLGPQRAVCERQ